MRNLLFLLCASTLHLGRKAQTSGHNIPICDILQRPYRYLDMKDKEMVFFEPGDWAICTIRTRACVNASSCTKDIECRYKPATGVWAFDRDL